ncbi:TnsD family Tn7-like transposition protein [Teredinibacter turnerae]|uniref:TnsD family Tn7-like transposition protein n=1 Tax=Teredinibacter turnerae TaxID=2426 RepID=UPI00037CFE28|nr:TnsD family Tn7-like transposition protein [Teredinibacter turnerae]
MLGYFPAPYNDELLYSLIGRYGLHTGLVGNQRALVREVFSSPTAVAVPDLPSHLNALVKNLQLVWPTSVIELINSFTLAPIYLPFLSQQQAKKIICSMSSASGGDIHTRCGLAASAIKMQEYFHYCPKCMKEQKRDHGEHYWRRAHQLPGIAYCGLHSCLLGNSTIHFHPKEKHRYFAAAAAVLDTPSNRHSSLSEPEKALQQRYEELLRAKRLKGLGTNRWTLFYRNLATELGLSRKSRILHQEIHQLLRCKWAGTSFEGQFQGQNEHYWLRNLFRKHRKSFHPLRHLLVTTALVPEWSISQLLNHVRSLPDAPMEAGDTHKVITVSRYEIKDYRERWGELLKQNPSLGVKALRSLEGGGRIYAWLYRNDKQWLMSNRPSKISKRNHHHTADYKKWDESNVVFLESAYKKMMRVRNRPRLTSTRFIKVLLRSNSVEKHLNDMPKTSQWIESHEETVEDHQLYRLKIACEKIRANNLVIKRWRLLRFACIRKELVTPRIDAEIQKMEKSRG